MSEHVVTLDDIQAAARCLTCHVLDTPCIESRTLGWESGMRIFLKFENLQATASLKK